MYLLTCKQCQKQYTWETTDDFRSRSNNGKFDRKESKMQEHLYRHLGTPGHMGFVSDVSVALIDKMDRSDPKKREDYWMKTLKSVVPYGLYIEDNVYLYS